IGRNGTSGHISQYKSTLTGIEQNGSRGVRSNLHSVSNGHRAARHEGKPRAPFARSVVVDLCRCDSRRRGAGASVRAGAKSGRPAAASRAAPRADADSRAQAVGDADFSENVVTPRELNANARIKIRATVGFAKRIDVERGTRLSFSGHVSV